MLDLQPRIHLHEIDGLGAVIEKLHRACAAIIDGLRRVDASLQQFLTHIGRQVRRGRFFDDFLMPSLDGTIALEHVDGVALAVAEDLHLQMACAGQVFLNQKPIIAKGGFGFALGGVQRFFQFISLLTMRIPLPPPPAVALSNTG